MVFDVFGDSDWHWSSLYQLDVYFKGYPSEGEADQTATCKDFLQVQQEGSREIKRNTAMYSLEAIIAVGYRVNSEQGTQFRQWATGILKNYIHKGYALDSNRMKYGSRFSIRYFDELYEEIKDIRTSERMIYQKITDIYATAIDYSPNAFESKKFCYGPKQTSFCHHRKNRRRNNYQQGKQ